MSINQIIVVVLSVVGFIGIGIDLFFNHIKLSQSRPKKAPAIFEKVLESDAKTQAIAKEMAHFLSNNQLVVKSITKPGKATTHSTSPSNTQDQNHVDLQLPDWNQYTSSASTQLQPLPTEVDQILSRTKEGQSLKRLLFLNQLPQPIGDHDISFANQAYRELLSDPSSTARTIENTLDALPESSSLDRLYLLSLCSRLAENDEAKQPVKSILYDQLKKRRQGRTPASEPLAFLLVPYLEMESEPSMRKQLLDEFDSARKDPLINELRGRFTSNP